jgi:hypothetical protein
MSNQYGLPEKKLQLIKARDVKCVYCKQEMFKPSSDIPRNDWATIEHLNHLPPWNNPKTIAICCGRCNSSRGNKTILEWFNSSFCKKRNVSPSTVALPVLDYIKDYEGYNDLYVSNELDG